MTKEFNLGSGNYNPKDLMEDITIERKDIDDN